MNLRKDHLHIHTANLIKIPLGSWCGFACLDLADTRDIRHRLCLCVKMFHSQLAFSTILFYSQLSVMDVLARRFDEGRSEVWWALRTAGFCESTETWMYSALLGNSRKLVCSNATRLCDRLCDLVMRLVRWCIWCLLTSRMMTDLCFHRWSILLSTCLGKQCLGYSFESRQYSPPNLSI